MRDAVKFVSCIYVCRDLIEFVKEKKKKPIVTRGRFICLASVCVEG